MPQTLLALLALTLAAFLTLNQQELTVRAQTNMVTDEIELASAGLSSEIVAFVDGRSFDERSTPALIAQANGVVPSVASAFTSSSQFGATDRGAAGCDLLHPANTPECDDIDDLDGITWQPVEVELAHGRSLPFEVRIGVLYVDSPGSMVAAATMTRHKRVLIDIRSPLIPAATEGIYRATRVISYDPIKAQMDYENSDQYDPTYGSDGGVTNEGTP